MAWSCMWNCVGLRSMIYMWQISKYTLTRLRVNLAGGEGQAWRQKARVSWGAGREGGKMHSGIAHAQSLCKKE